MLGVLGTVLIVLLVYGGTQSWPLWLIAPSVVLQIIVSVDFPPGKMATLSERGMLGKYIVMGIFIQGAVAFALYGLGYGIASMF